jgi:uncharacterized delta-60 repeat protein
MKRQLLIVSRACALFIAIALTSATTLLAQTDGSVDSTYQADLTGTGTIVVLIQQPDGKLILGGTFDTFQNLSARGVMRINSDGSLDQVFLPPTVNGPVRAAALQSDGKIVIGGTFTSVNGSGAVNIARLNADGSLDTSFSTGTGFNSDVNVVKVLSSGRILVGGLFTSFNGTATGSLAALLSSGARDTNFSSLVEGIGAGSPGQVSAIDVQANNAIVIGGNFRMVGGVARNRIARLTASGANDATFNPGSGADLTVRSVLAQADGNIMLAGLFSNVNGTPRANVARLTSVGVVDPGFDPAPGSDNFAIRVAAATNGKYFVFGVFSAFDGQPRASIARLNADGTLDGSWTTPFVGMTSTPVSPFSAPGVSAVIANADGTTFIAGGFRVTGNTGTMRNSIALLDTVGDISLGFDAGIGARTAIGPDSILTTASGQAIVGGSFDAVNSTLKAYLARLNNDATLDGSFATAGSGPDGALDVLLAQPDGSIIISGEFENYDGALHRRLVRIDSNGIRDPNFNPVLTFNGTGNITGPMLALQPTDNRILIAGDFNEINGDPYPGLARLNTDGTTDTLFDPGTGAETGGIDALAAQNDGSIVVAGNFTIFNGTPKNSIARLMSTGALDGTFDAGTGADNNITLLAVQPDGRILIGGGFSTVNGAPRSGIARLTTTGTVDTSFDPGTGFPPTGFNNNGVDTPTVTSLLLQSDGRMLVGGSFASYNGSLAQSIVRLHNDAGFDSTFCVGDGPSRAGVSLLDPNMLFTGNTFPVTSLALQPDGRLLVGGDFTFFDGSPHRGLVRLSTAPAARLINLSTRGFVSTGNGIMIAGFIIRGNTPKRVLIRAIGPSLTQAGVAGALANPQVTVVDRDGQPVASNDDWQTPTANGVEVQNTGLAPGNPNESAVVATLDPGRYTALVSGVGGTTGVGLVEVFDLETPNARRLVNVSTRAMVSTGAGVTIAGFQLRQDHRILLIRGIGPSLPLSGTLANPTMQLYDSNGVVLASNDDWQSSPVADSIEATGRAPSNARESAILVDLNAGDYTCILSGVGGTTGIGLIEVYEVN